MKRRRFVQACAASVAGMSLPDASRAATLTARLYHRAKLVDDQGNPIQLDSLKVGTNYVFDYPYSSTPCFLLRLERPATAAFDLKTGSGQPYRWEGGIGAARDVVAYSAICAHKLTYPTKQVSFIGYRNEPSPVAPKGKVITCCSDRSVYDPAAGARVVSGPAPQPLATILLEHDPAAGEVWAAGTFGGEMFAEFFRRFDFRLQLEMGPRARSQVEGTTVVKELENYSTQWAKC
jgi:arsenite oxidase small subunit